MRFDRPWNNYLLGTGSLPQYIEIDSLHTCVFLENKLAFIERLGGPPDLEAEFTKLVIDELNGRSLDEKFEEYSKAGKFPDFACFDDMLLIEMKNLETSQTNRINGAIDAIIPTEDRTIFYGERLGSGIDINRDMRKKIDRHVLNKLTKTLDTLLKQARKQFANFRLNNPKEKTVNVLVILNSTVSAFNAETVMYCVELLNNKGNKKPRFGIIDAVFFSSEKHIQNTIDGKSCFVTTVQHMNNSFDSCPWKQETLSILSDRWAKHRAISSFQNINFFQVSELRPMEIVNDTPTKLRNGEYWLLEYKRNPYLRANTDHELEILFHRSIAKSAEWGLIGDWPKPDSDQIKQGNREFTHINEEINHRNIDIREFDLSNLTSSEKNIVFHELPQELIKIMDKGSRI